MLRMSGVQTLVAVCFCDDVLSAASVGWWRNCIRFMIFFVCLSPTVVIIRHVQEIRSERVHDALMLR